MGPGRHRGPFFSPRVSCSLEVVALARVVRISAKPTKRLQDALQPILAKYGLNLQQVSLRQVRAVAGGLGWAVGRVVGSWSCGSLTFPAARRGAAAGPGEAGELGGHPDAGSGHPSR